jgi:CO/xanthine dehydrogenase Mo-binding subunit
LLGLAADGHEAQLADELEQLIALSTARPAGALMLTELRVPTIDQRLHRGIHDRRACSRCEAGPAAVPAREAHRRARIAVGTAFNSIVATVVKVFGNAKSFKVTRVSVALDSCLVVNPASVAAQISDGVVHGLNAALDGQQTFKNGVAERTNFNANRMIRLDEMPQVSVVLIPPLRPIAAWRSARWASSVCPRWRTLCSRLPGSMRAISPSSRKRPGAAFDA